MLFVLDQEKNYKVVRSSSDQDGNVRRERIGVIPKNNLEIPQELKAAVSAEEMKELASTVELLRDARVTRLKAKVFDFPTLAREVVEYVISAGSEQEQRLVATAVLEALRLIRKAERSHSATAGD